ncbi:MAG: hypothetical protein Q9209_001521 [Squamulea sp. 1 TL-2023]
MERHSEKTFGISPESKAPKQQKKHTGNKRSISPANATDDDTAHESDSLFIPPSKGRTNTYKKAVNSGTASKSRKVETSSNKMSMSGNPSDTTIPKRSPIDKAPAVVDPPLPRPRPSSAKLGHITKTTKPTNTAKSPLRSPASNKNVLDSLGTFTGLPSSNVMEDDQEATKAQTDIPKKTKAQQSQPRKSHGRNQDTEGTNIVAIDFGTTFSGVCWAQTRVPKAQRPINQWPDPISNGFQGVSSDKVPTEVQYTEDGFKWGFQISSDAQRHKWFKLALDPDNKIDIGYAKLDYSDPDPQAAPPGYNQEPEDIVVDYLTALRKHLEASDLAVARTRKCAERAGIAPLLAIVSEPEAAATWALQEVTPGSFAIGDTFVVCDAGGGTVDLISYKVTALKPILRVVEVAPGRGKKCGSTFLNRRFETFLRSHETLRSRGQQTCFLAAEQLVDFSQIKRYFDGSKTQQYQIPVPTFPDSEDHDVRRARYTLKGTDLYNIFEPIIQDVIDLVWQQIEATKSAKSNVKAVLLVGGFGDNSYLYKRLCESVALAPGIDVLKSPNGWTAVVRGALVKGLADHNPKTAEMNIAGRSAGNHYGTESAKEWDKTVHPESQRFWSAANSRWEVNTYDWFIHKNDTVSEKKPIRLAYHTECLATVKKLDPITVTIIKCLDPDSSGAPFFVGDGEVTPVANLEVPLSLIPTKNLKKRQSEDGQQWYIVDFVLKITRSSAEFHYDLMHGKKSYGRVSAEFV